MQGASSLAASNQKKKRMDTTTRLSKNSHQEFDGLKAALCLGSLEAKSNTASEMPLRLRPNGIRSRSSGKERDAETGLHYFGARYFSGAQGRFTGPDVAGPRLNDLQSFNKYAYTRIPFGALILTVVTIETFTN
jgi:RHS repeat-associated protein